MDNLRRLSPRDFAVLVAVIGGHVVLLALLPRLGIQRAPTSPPERTLLLIELAPAARLETPAQPRGISRPRARKRVPQTAPESSAITSPVPEDSAPRVDWQLEAERTARDAAARQGPRAFGEQPFSPYRECEQRKSSLEWNPDPHGVGFEGLLPFVRVGKRCVVGLGFFGCGIGKLPEANSGLLADMHSPDEPESSVPAPEDCRPRD